MSLFCSSCYEDDERSVPAVFVIDGESLCTDHGKIAMAVRKEVTAAKERVHGAGGRVTRRG